MNEALQPGFVLHSRSYGDHDRLLELWLQHEGRQVAIARGAAKGGKRALSLFQPLLLNLTGRGEVRRLGRTEPSGAGFRLAGKALYAGLYVNEILVRLTHRDEPMPLSFAAYLACISELAACSSLENPLRRFELVLLGELGFLPNLEIDADTRAAIEDDGRYQYVSGRGITKAIGGATSVSGRTLLALANGENLSERQLPAARALLRGMIAERLGGRPLKSRELFKQAQRSKHVSP